MRLKSRNSNLELLRIISILMIIGLHYSDPYIGGALGVLTPNDINYYIAHFLESEFIVGVNLFVITSAYFLVDCSTPKVTKTIKLILLSYFYGILFYIISLMLSLVNFSLLDMIKKSGLFLDDGYWYVKFYIILYLISPFLNILINNLSKTMFRGLISIMLLFFSIWPSFLPYPPSNDNGYGIISFVLLYFIGSYIKKYYKSEKSKQFYIFIYIGCVSITFLFSFWTNSWGYNFIFNLIGSAALFILFTKINIKSNLINYLASYTFPIYLIHFNPLLIALVFKGLLKCQNFYTNKFFIFHMFVSILVVFTISFFIEFIRKIFIAFLKKLISKKYITLLEKKYKYIDELFYNFIYK